MRSSSWVAVAGLVAATVAASEAAAQTIASRVNAVRDGSVLLSFAARAGVCGDGRGSVWISDRDKLSRASDRGWVCVVGPVRVTLGRADGQTVSIRKCVACRPRSVSSGDVDLGEVPADDAAKYLLDLARRSGSRNADEAVSAAAFADAGDLTDDFVRLVRDEEAMLEARRQALFWFGQADGSTRDLVALYDALKPRTLREHFTFVLSQRHDDLAVGKLIDIARNDSDRQVRKQAMFWLGQSSDPKAVKFFKDVLSP